MASIGFADAMTGGPAEKDVLHRFDTLNWQSWWQMVCDLERSLAEEPPRTELSVEIEDRRDVIAVETLGLALDLDEEWMLYRMKTWVRELETQIRDIFS